MTALDRETRQKIDDHVREVAVELLTKMVADECYDVPVEYHGDVASNAFYAGEETFWDWYSQYGCPTGEVGIKDVLDQIGTGIDLSGAAEDLREDWEG